jgi:hypothetical protein
VCVCVQPPDVIVEIIGFESSNKGVSIKSPKKFMETADNADELVKRIGESKSGSEICNALESFDTLSK